MTDDARPLEYLIETKEYKITMPVKGNFLSFNAFLDRGTARRLNHVVLTGDGRTAFHDLGKRVLTGVSKPEDSELVLPEDLSGKRIFDYNKVFPTGRGAPNHTLLLTACSIPLVSKKGARRAPGLTIVGTHLNQLGIDLFQPFVRYDSVKVYNQYAADLLVGLWKEYMDAALEFLPKPE